MPQINEILPSLTDCLSPERARLLATARQKLDRHVGGGGRWYRARGALRPCPRSELAAFTLKAIQVRVWSPTSGETGTVQKSAATGYIELCSGASPAFHADPQRG